LAIGAHGISLMNEIRVASNAKAKRELSWKPFLLDVAPRLPGRPWLTPSTRCRLLRAFDALSFAQGRPFDARSLLRRSHSTRCRLFKAFAHSTSVLA
jgi:hypothetical protein